jgi:hypothetical protein
MVKDLEELNREFNQSANEAFHSLYTRLENNRRELDRRRDENVFQHTCAKYVETLKAELQTIALTLMEKNQNLRELNLLRRNLTNRIHDFLQEFTLKSQSL